MHFYKRYAKTEKTKTIAIKVVAGILFLIIFTNRVALVFKYVDVNWLDILLDSICSTSSTMLINWDE